jgi:CheY-like chemotaxis protein
MKDIVLRVRDPEVVMSKGTCKVLVVDDDADTREALAEALAEAGFSVEQASDGDQALACIQQSGEPDVILLDLRMPGMDGPQFLERIRESPTRVIVLTGDASARVVRLARDAKLLAKPLDLDKLEAAVKEACAA